MLSLNFMVETFSFLKASRHEVQTSQLFEDPEASGGVFSGTRRFVASAATSGIKTATVIVQPGVVGCVRVFERHYVTILDRGTINSVPGEDLESDVVVTEPGVP